MRWLVMVGLMLVGLGSPVQAADLGGDYRDRGSLKDEVYAPRFNWTGGYAGLQFGWAWADTDAISGRVPGPFDQGYGYSPDGFVGGGHVGFNLQNGNIVYGIEGDLEFSDINGGGTGSLGSAHSTDVDWLGSVRGRVGYALDRNLIYVTGGWAFGDVAIRSESGGVTYSDVRHGWTLGAGYEYAFSSNMTGRLEYRYTDLGSELANNGAFKDDSDVTFSAVRAGVSIKF